MTPHRFGRTLDGYLTITVLVGFMAQPPLQQLKYEKARVISTNFIVRLPTLALNVSSTS